jgi:hypothetical protein
VWKQDRRSNGLSARARRRGGKVHNGEMVTVLHDMPRSNIVEVRAHGSLRHLRLGLLDLDRKAGQRPIFNSFFSIDSSKRTYLDSKVKSRRDSGHGTDLEAFLQKTPQSEEHPFRLNVSVIDDPGDLALRSLVESPTDLDNV